MEVEADPPKNDLNSVSKNNAIWTDFVGFLIFQVDKLTLGIIEIIHHSTVHKKC